MGIIRIGAPAISISLLLSALSPLALARDDPLEVLCTGHAGSMAYMASMLKREPITNAVIIPTRVTGSVVTPQIVQRYMRLYFPRTYEELIEKYELLLLRGIDAYFFTATQLEWMRRAIDEGGLGGLQDRSVMSSLASYSGPWAQSVTSQAFPNDADAVTAVDYNRMGDLEVIINEDASLPKVLTPYKDLLNLDYGYWSNSLMIPRQGSQTYAWSKTRVFPEFSYTEPGVFPHVLGWRYGNGYTWSLQDYSLSGFWSEGRNPYGPDAYWGMLMYSTGRELPTDVVRVHQLRIRFQEYGEAKGFIFSLIDFVDRFGANTNTLEERIFEMDERWKESKGLYLEQNYGGSWSILGELLNEVSSLRMDALRLKDRALFWIYVAEWLVVSGTSLIASFVVWILMVRKRLYKRVKITRLAVFERHEL